MDKLRGLLPENRELLVDLNTLQETTIGIFLRSH